jgi:putative NADH-flavin reductase
VSSFFFTHTECKNACRKTVQFGTLFELPALHLLGQHLSVWRHGQLVVQDNAEQGIANVDFAVAVADETQFPEFVHEKIHT